MGELLFCYSCFALLIGPGALPSFEHGFMPFQENYLFWKIIGFAGLGCWQARWLVQWLHSEKHKESRMPVSFWWISLGGAAFELCYFLRQQDSVGILGYCFSFIPITRNLVLVYRKRRQDAAPGFPVVGSHSDAGADH